MCMARLGAGDKMPKITKGADACPHRKYSNLPRAKKSDSSS